MKLFWRDEEKQSILLTEPAAKLLSIDTQGGKFQFLCLGYSEILKVSTLDEAKRLAIVRFQGIVARLYNAVMELP